MSKSVPISHIVFGAPLYLVQSSSETPLNYPTLRVSNEKKTDLIRVAFFPEKGERHYLKLSKDHQVAEGELFTGLWVLVDLPQEDQSVELG